MNAIWTIMMRELRAFFVSPTAYIVLTAWLLYQGLTFYLLAAFFAGQPYVSTDLQNSPLRMFFGSSTLFYIPFFIVVPVLTMRLLAEEWRTGTLESLLTAPVTDLQVVLGKYLAAMVSWVALWLPTLLYVVILGQYGDVDWGVVAACYIGVLGMGLYYMALGLLMSAVARSQVVAAVLTFMAVGLLFLMSIGEFVSEGTAQEVFKHISVWSHMDDFSKGIVDSRHLIFDVSLALLALFLTLRVLEGRRYQ